MLTHEFHFSHVVRPGAVCRVLRVQLDPGALIYGNSMLEIEATGMSAWQEVSEDILAPELKEVDEHLLNVMHDCLFKKAAEVAQIMLNLAPPVN